jgi:hypothetical protein
MKIPMIAILSLLLSVSASAQSQTRSVQSTNGVKIRLSYVSVYRNTSSNKPSSTTDAENVTVTAYSPSFQGTEKIRVVLVNQSYSKGQCGVSDHSSQVVAAVDLSYNSINRTFQGTLNGETPVQTAKGWMPWRQVYYYKAPSLNIRFDGYCYTGKSSLEAAAVVNGQWLKDPVNGTSNFQIRL